MFKAQAFSRRTLTARESRGQRQRLADFSLGTVITSIAGYPAKRTTAMTATPRGIFLRVGFRELSLMCTQPEPMSLRSSVHDSQAQSLRSGRRRKLIFHPAGNAGGFASAAETQAKGTFLYGAGVNYTLTKQPSLRAEYRAMSIKTPILGSEPLTRTVGPIRCNHQLELFSDSDRESWQAGPFPACHAFLNRRIGFC